MFSSELVPEMSCWKGSSIYSSRGTERFVQGRSCRHSTPLTLGQVFMGINDLNEEFVQEGPDGPRLFLV